MSVKRCSKCKTEKPVEEFYGRRPDCKDCVKDRVNSMRLADPEKEKERTRTQYAKHREKRVAYSAAWRDTPERRARAAGIAKLWRENNKERSDDLKRKSLYGMKPGEYTLMFSAQGGKCAICGTTEAGGRGTSFHIDHDHNTGKIRALLCSNCNTGLGKFKNRATLLKAAKFFQDHED